MEAKIIEKLDQEHITAEDIEKSWQTLKIAIENSADEVLESSRENIIPWVTK